VGHYLSPGHLKYEVGLADSLWTAVQADPRAHTAVLSLSVLYDLNWCVSEVKQELEDLMADIKKTANKVRAKLKGKF
jgi:hypothetical protein